MKFSAENPRYIAYTNSAYGYVEVGTANRKAEAWKLADDAVKQANIDNVFASHAEIYDKAANNGQGGMSFRVNMPKKQPAKPEFILVYVNQGSEYDAPSFTSRKAAQAYKEEQVVDRGVEIMTRKQWDAFKDGAQTCDTQDEQDALLDKTLNR
ncbi:hypothetical protein [Hymenobacter sp. UYP22]|uniref:hypothetical protein n=1 Tax=Hymenobacter sp. UYP22 TaxID=3156348 RepID=UPI0033922D90